MVWCSVPGAVYSLDLHHQKHILNVLGQVVRGCAQTEFDSPVYTLTSTHQTGAFPLKLARTISVSNPLHGIYPLPPKYYSHRLLGPCFVTARLHSSTTVALASK